MLPPPTLAQFELTPAIVAQLDQRRQAIDASFWKIAVGCAVAAALVAVALADPRAPGSDVIKAVVGFDVGGGMFGIMFGVPFIQWAATAIARLDRRQRRYERYQAAQRADADAGAALEAWHYRTRAAFWLALNGHAFERELAIVLRQHGFAVGETRGSGDGGVDLVLKRAERTILVQCKRQTKPIGPAVARELWGTVQHHDAGAGSLATVAGASAGVHAFRAHKPLARHGPRRDSDAARARLRGRLQRV